MDNSEVWDTDKKENSLLTKEDQDASVSDFGAYCIGKPCCVTSQVKSLHLMLQQALQTGLPLGQLFSFPWIFKTEFHIVYVLTSLPRNSPTLSKGPVSLSQKPRLSGLTKQVPTAELTFRR